MEVQRMTNQTKCYYNGNDTEHVINKENHTNQDSAYYKVKSNEFKEQANYSDEYHNSNETLDNEIRQSDAENVVFERIVPKVVKDLWVKAVQSSDSDYSIDKEHNNHQIMMMRHDQSLLDKKISQEYGDALLSRDIAIEEQKKSIRILANKNISESPELPSARDKWGVTLKHVVKENHLDENANEKNLPLDYPELRRLSNGTKPRPHSMSEEQMLDNVSNLKRSRSVDILDLDATDGNMVPENDKRISVLERRRTFERGLLLPKEEDLVDFVPFKPKSPKKRNSLLGPQPSFFYQGEESQDKIYADMKAAKKRPVSLLELLKQDELKLNRDVISQFNDNIEKSQLITKQEGSQPKVKENSTIKSESCEAIVKQEESKPKVKENSPIKSENHTAIAEESSILAQKKSARKQKDESVPTAHGNNQFSGRNKHKVETNNDLRNVHKEFDFSIKSEKNDHHKDGSKPVTVPESNVSLSLTQENIAGKSKNAIVSSGEKTSNPQRKPKIVRKIIAAAAPVSSIGVASEHDPEKKSPVSVKNEVSRSSISLNENQKSSTPASVSVPTNEKLQGFNNNQVFKRDFSADTKATSNEEVALQKTVRYNKLGQVILDDLIPTQIVKTTSSEDHREEKITHKPSKEVSASNSKPIQQRNDQSSKNFIDGASVKSSGDKSSKEVSTSISKPIQQRNDHNSKKFIDRASVKSREDIPSKEVSVSISKPIQQSSKNFIDRASVKSNEQKENSIFYEKPVSIDSPLPNNKNRTPMVEIIKNTTPIPMKRPAPKPPAQTPTTDANVKNQPSLSQQNRRVGKLIIMTGEQRDEQLKNKSKNVSNAVSSPTDNVRQVTLNKELVAGTNSQNSSNFLALSFMSNALDEADDPNDPSPVVPKIIHNQPVVGLKSIMSSGVNRNKNRKKTRVSFSTIKLATIYSYPSESSFYEDDKKTNAVNSVSLAGLSSYQPSTVNNLGSVIQRERNRIQFSHEQPTTQDSASKEFLYSSEGAHFNTHHSQEGGHALLF